MYLFKNIFNFFIGLLFLASCSSIPGLSDKSYADLPTHDHIKCVGSCDVKLK